MTVNTGASSYPVLDIFDFFESVHKFVIIQSSDGLAQSKPLSVVSLFLFYSSLVVNFVLTFENFMDSRKQKVPVIALVKVS